jgi:hypothetical protein
MKEKSNFFFKKILKIDIHHRNREKLNLSCGGYLGLFLSSLSDSYIFKNELLS